MIGAESSAHVTAHFSEDTVEIGGGVREHPGRRHVPRQSVGEEVTVADQFRPRFDAGGNASIDPLRLGEIASRYPKALDGKPDQNLVVPRRLVAREDLPQLFERSDEGVEDLIGGHSSRVPAAPGTSSVMTCT